MQIQHSKDAQEILKRIHANGELNSAQVISLSPLPHSEWWKIISDASRVTNAKPYNVAVNEIMRAREANPTIPSWPAGMYEKENGLPSISSDEAIAILDKFFLAENNSLKSGKLLYMLQWDVLAAEYCPLRERYSILKTLVSNGKLLEPSGRSDESELNLEWPLSLTDSGISEIQRYRLTTKLPFFLKIETFLSSIKKTYPESIRVIVWLLVGGGAVKIIEYICSITF